MLYRSTFLILSAALTTSGILLPPQLSSTGIQFSDRLKNVLSDKPQNRVVAYDCEGCGTQESSDPEEEGPKSLILNFTIPTTAPDSLFLNDHQVFAPRHGSKIGPEPITAALVPKVDQSKDIDSSEDEVISASTEARLGFELSSISVPVKNPDYHVVTLSFRVLQVDTKFIGGLETLEITLYQWPNRRLTLGTIEKRPTPAISPSEQGQAGGEKECTSLPLLCKWRAIIAARVRKMKTSFKGCHKFSSHRTPRPSHVDSHHAFRPHHQPAQGRRHGTFHIIKRIAFQIIVPVFVGIAAGMAASLLGMVVGQCIVFVWRRFYRNKRQGSYVRVADSEEVTDDFPSDEKTGDGETDLPAYKDAAEPIIPVEKQEE
ncbi:MAG: hypothetical protein M1837_004580 [Sclerophora amabilis]|nr:MAG: hypothetical protein M1837_004580 [Sclerophora amabilis]